MTELYRDSRVVVETNGSGEIFIHPIDNPDAQIRVSSAGPELHITAYNGHLTPWAVNGLSAIRVTTK